MARQQIIIRAIQSAAGTSLLGVGLFMLYGTVGGWVTGLNHILAHHSPALGTLPALILAVSEMLQSHAVHGQHLLASLASQMWVSSWPLLLVIAGSVLSGETEITPQKTSGDVSI